MKIQKTFWVINFVVCCHSIAQDSINAPTGDVSTSASVVARYPHPYTYLANRRIMSEILVGELNSKKVFIGPLFRISYETKDISYCPPAKLLGPLSTAKVSWHPPTLNEVINLKVNGGLANLLLRQIDDSQYYGLDFSLATLAEQKSFIRKHKPKFLDEIKESEYSIAKHRNKVFLRPNGKFFASIDKEDGNLDAAPVGFCIGELQEGDFDKFISALPSFPDDSERPPHGLMNNREKSLVRWNARNKVWTLFEKGCDPIEERFYEGPHQGTRTSIKPVLDCVSDAASLYNLYPEFREEIMERVKEYNSTNNGVFGFGEFPYDNRLSLFNKLIKAHESAQKKAIEVENILDKRHVYNKVKSAKPAEDGGEKIFNLSSNDQATDRLLPLAWNDFQSLMKLHISGLGALYKIPAEVPPLEFTSEQIQLLVDQIFSDQELNPSYDESSNRWQPSFGVELLIKIKNQKLVQEKLLRKSKLKPIFTVIAEHVAIRHLEDIIEQDLEKLRPALNTKTVVAINENDPQYDPYYKRKSSYRHIRIPQVIVLPENSEQLIQKILENCVKLTLIKGRQYYSKEILSVLGYDHVFDSLFDNLKSDCANYNYHVGIEACGYIDYIEWVRKLFKNPSIRKSISSLDSSLALLKMDPSTIDTWRSTGAKHWRLTSDSIEFYPRN